MEAPIFEKLVAKIYDMAELDSYLEVAAEDLGIMHLAARYGNEKLGKLRLLDNLYMIRLRSKLERLVL